MVKRARMTGFLVLDYKHRYAEAMNQLTLWIRDGWIRCCKHILNGIDQAPHALEMLYQGRNSGKLLIKI